MELLTSENPELFLKPKLVTIGGCSFRSFDYNQQETNEKNANTLAPYVEYDDNMLSCTELDDQFEMKYTKSGQIMVEFHTAAAYFSSIVGMKGMTKKGIERDTNTRIKVPKSGETGNITITGESERQVSSAYSRVQMIVFQAKDKQMMTHFISIPCMSDSIRENFENFKVSVLNGPPLRGVDETIFQNSDKFHLTLVALVLMDETEEKVADETLIDCQQEIKSIFETAGNISLVLHGLEIMNDDPTEVDVLYGKVSINPPKYNTIFQNMADQVLEKYTKKGFLRKQYDRVKLHVTLMNSLFRKNKQSSSSDKPPSRKIRESFDASYILDKYKNYNFGETDLSKLHLSICMKRTRNV